MRFVVVMMAAAILMAGCAAGGSGVPEGEVSSVGPGSGMQARHHMAVPEAYAGLSNPVVEDDAALAKGAEIYATFCASCHGEDGMGNGPAAMGLDPGPAPVAHTSQMLSDGYLFWRITEGGAQFESAMVAYENILDETSRWQLIHYIRSLGRGEPVPAVDLETREAQLKAAMEQGVITAEEGELFRRVHAALDTYLAENADNPSEADMTARMESWLEAMTQAGLVTEADAGLFLDVHGRMEGN